MNNVELDARLELLFKHGIPYQAEKLIKANGGERSVQIELELLLNDHGRESKTCK